MEKKKSKEKDLGKKVVEKKKIKETSEVKGKIIKKTGIEETPAVKKDQIKSENKILRNILIVIGVIFILVIGGFLYTDSLKFNKYENIEFRAANLGNEEYPLIMYETITLAMANDGSNSEFGFRIRTNPKEFKKINFEGLDNFTLMKRNGYYYEDELSCEGKEIIALESLNRFFSKTGMGFFPDIDEMGCDSEGRYNYFIFKYGDKTEIKEVGNKCYELIVEKDEESCEILPVTEKLMVELFSKYLLLE